MKWFVQSKLSDGGYKLCEFFIMACGITPKAQPIDAFIGKLIKTFYKEFYDEYSLTAPVNPITKYPLPPTRQLCSSWVCKAFDKIPQELIKKAWAVCGYNRRGYVE